MLQNLTEVSVVSTLHCLVSDNFYEMSDAFLVVQG